MRNTKSLRKIFRIILFIQMFVITITICLTVLVLDKITSIPDVDTIARYYTGDGFGGTYLEIRSDGSFFYNRWLDSYPGPRTNGIWRKSNDTIELNAKRNCIYMRDSADSRWIERDCITFKNAKFKLYPDSIVYISGISDFTTYMNLEKFR